MHGLEQLKQNKEKSLHRREISRFVFIVCLFIFCLLWYTRIYPVSILAVDDWTYISYKRFPFPLISEWNPIKVFPEIYMPMMGYGGAFLIYPVTGNYLQAITLALGLGTSFIVVLYVESFRRFLVKKSEITDSASILPTILFMLFHFTTFLSNTKLNNYLLGGDAPINLYNYTLPSLLNFSTIFILESTDNIYTFLKSEKNTRVGLLFIMIYFSIFSNLFCSIILVSYTFVKFMSAVIVHRESFQDIFKNNILSFPILFLWLISLLFEFNGGRAHSLMKSSSVSELIFVNAYTGLDYFIRRWRTVNIPCFLVCLFFSTMTILIILKNRSTEQGNSIGAVFFRFCVLATISAILTIMFIYLLCLVSKPKYTYETFVWISFLPWLFVISVYSLTYLQRKYKKAIFLTPLLLCIISLSCLRYIGTLEENTIHNLPPSTCIALNQYVMDQILKADKNEQEEMLLTLPVTNRTNSVTFSAPIHGERVVRTMYFHHLIQRNLKVYTEYSYEINEMFRLDEELRSMDTSESVKFFQ